MPQSLFGAQKIAAVLGELEMRLDDKGRGPNPRSKLEGGRLVSCGFGDIAEPVVRLREPNERLDETLLVSEGLELLQGALVVQDRISYLAKLYEGVSEPCAGGRLIESIS